MTPAALNFGGVTVAPNIANCTRRLPCLSLGCDDILATKNARLNLFARSRPGVDPAGTLPHQEHTLVKRSLTLTAIVSIIFFNVSGGPYGLESVLNDGPGMACC